MIGEHLSWSQAALVIVLLWLAVFAFYFVAVLCSCARTVKRGATLKAPDVRTKRNGTEAVP